MSYRLIQNILDTQLATVSDLPVLIKQNESGALEARYDRYVRSTLLPAETVDLTMGLSGFDQMQGLFQIDVFMPADDGIDGSNYMADQIIAAFPSSNTLTSGSVSVRILKVWLEPSQQSTNYLMTPVMIRWQTCIARP